MNGTRRLIAVTMWLPLVGGVAASGQETPPASPPASRPATGLRGNRYELAGAVRREAGIRTYMFVHPTWINWRPANYTSPYARELIDSYLLIMVDQADHRPADGVKAAGRIAQAGMSFVPGLRLGPRREYKEWTDPAAWRRELEFYRLIQRTFELGPAAPLAVDMEPPWDKEPRYPRVDDVYAMTQALGEWRDVARKTELWVLPGGVHYWNSWVLASLRAPHGPVHVLDEATYGRCGNNDAKLAEMIRQRADFMQSVGMDYVPGFYLRHAVDPTLYETLKRYGIKRCWFYCDATVDQWAEFGTLQWKHSR